MIDVLISVSLRSVLEIEIKGETAFQPFNYRLTGVSPKGRDVRISNRVVERVPIYGV